MDINSFFTPLTLICIGIILLVFLFLLLFIKRVSVNNTLIEKRRLINQFPSLISTLGVLFTFIGITVGLVGFDTSDLDTSIPLLLDGLKTAFVTSIMGMLGSMILSNIINSKFDNTDKGVSDINIAAGLITKSVSDMSSANIEVLKVLLQQQEKQLKLVEIIHNDNLEIINILSESSNSQYNEKLLETNTILKSLSSTVVTIKDDLSAFKLSEANELQSIQRTLKSISDDTSNLSSINDNIISSLEALGNLDASEQHVSEEIDKLGVKIGDNISTIVTKMNETEKFFISKLKDVTSLLEKNDIEQMTLYMKKFASDFQNQMNALINKLVSDNFKELNNSIKVLCSWQQENKDMIQTLTSQYKQMADNFEDTSTTLSDVEDYTRQLVDDGGKLSALIFALNQVLLEDKNFVVAINRLKEAADINKTNSLALNQSASNLNSWISSQKDFVTGVKKLVEKLDEISKFRDYNNAFWKDTKHKLNEGIDILNEGNEKMNNQIAEIDKHFYARLNTTLANLDACIQAMYNGKIK